jgi:hypothetical protein
LRNPKQPSDLTSSLAPYERTRGSRFTPQACTTSQGSKPKVYIY